MTRGRSSGLVPFNPEPQRLHRLSHLGGLGASNETTAHPQDHSEEETVELDPDHSANMALPNAPTMSDYARPNLTGTGSSIVRPPIDANNFELKPSVIQMVQQYAQFDGLQDEDPNLHLASFLEICDTFKINGVTNDAIRLRLFPFSLRHKAKQWLISLPRGSITTWESMIEKFLMKYFPPSKTSQLRNAISTFQQLESESLYDTWERFKELLRKCPHHALPSWLQIQTFYSGLKHSTRQMIDAASGGTLNNKTPEAAQVLIEDMAMNNYQWTTPRQATTKPAGIYEVDSVTALAIQMEKLHQKMDNLSLAPASGPDNMEAPPEQVDYMGNSNRQPFNPITNNPYSPTYNPGWRNHPNFSWGGQQNAPKPTPYGPANSAPDKPNLEEMLAKFMQTTEATIRNHEGTIRNLETQIGQLAKLISARQVGALPGNTETNPKADKI